jgi:hypothetical protein
MDAASIGSTEEGKTMIERVHEHLFGELRQNTRTDTIFILTAILLNLLVMGVNSAVVMEDSNGSVETSIMYIFILFSVVVNVAAIFGLLKGKRMRLLLLNGLIKMYKDQQVEQYYDPLLLRSYSIRYYIFITVVVFVGLVSIAIPILIRYL